MKTIKIMLLMLLVWNLTDYFFLRANTSAYIELDKVYAGFDMKKEYEQKVKNEQLNTKNRIDSLELELKQMTLKISSMDSIKERSEYRKEIGFFISKREKYLEIKESLEYRFGENLKSYEDKIWTQINAYSKKFGSEANYDYVFGVAGTGSVMYSKEENNVTEEFLAYINEKYKGE